MRQLQTQEVKAVSGAGVLTNVLTTGAQATVALGTGLFNAGTIVVKPLATGTWNLIKFIV